MKKTIEIVSLFVAFAFGCACALAAIYYVSRNSVKDWEVL